MLLFLRITRSASSDVAVVHITDPCVEDPGVPQACELECRLSTYQTAHRPSAPPPGFRSVTPRMVVADLEGAVELLRTVFGATGDVHADRPAEVRIGDSVVMVSGAGERELFPAMVRDPFGNAFQIAHRLPPERQRIDSNLRLPRSTLKQD